MTHIKDLAILYRPGEGNRRCRNCALLSPKACICNMWQELPTEPDMMCSMCAGKNTEPNKWSENEMDKQVCKNCGWSIDKHEKFTELCPVIVKIDGIPEFDIEIKKTKFLDEKQIELF